MTEKDLIIEITHQFPMQIGLVLTGSQANSQQFSTNSDIDVIVFDKGSSDTHSYGMTLYEYKVDCTVIPILDIENVMYNETEHARGVLLTMLSQGRFISGDETLLLSLRVLATKLVSEQSHSIQKLSDNLGEELFVIDKYFKRELSEAERMIMVCELIHTVGRAEAIRLSSRDANYLKRAKTIQEQNPAFMNEMLNLFNKINWDSDTALVTPFIDSYLKSINTPKVLGAENYLAVDIELVKIPVRDFTEKILPELLENPILKNAYRYFFQSDKKYHRLYRFDITIVFSLVGNTSQLDVLSALKKEFPQENLTYQVPQMFKDDSMELSICLNRLFEVSLYPLRTPYLAGMLCQQFAVYLQLRMTDLINLNKMLYQKWILTRTEQSKLTDHAYTIRLQNKRLKSMEQYYRQHKESISRAYAWQNDVADPLTDILQVAMTLLVTSINNIEKLPEYKYFPDELFGVMEISDIENGKRYLLMVQKILRMLNLSDLEKTHCVFFLSLNLIDS